MNALSSGRELFYRPDYLRSEVELREPYMPNYVGPLRHLRGVLEEVAGREAAERITEDMEGIKNSSKPEAVALWVRDAMERMDGLLDEGTRESVMVRCGRNCAEVNRRPVEAAVRRREKRGSLEEFLEVEQKKPPRGTRLEREGDTLYHYYTPISFREGLRCYCGLLRDWEAVLGRPVEVELIHSSISGADECKFAVHL